MISAKEAKQKIIKSISKRKYIKIVEASIYCATIKDKFSCTINIDEYDDTDEDIITTSRNIINWLEYYGYRATIITRDSKKCTIEISWNV